MEEVTKKSASKNRAWVKPAAIIFFLILFILTFFSNTIMNYSLAQVDTKRVTSGKITVNIRGTGTVEANDTFDVIMYETRKIKDVLVSVGDIVEEGDVLFILEEGKSTELKEAQRTLEDLERQYQEAMLTSSSSDYASEKANIAALEQALADAKRERSAFGTTTTTVSAATEAVRLAQIEVNNITAEKTTLEDRLNLIDEDNSEWETITNQISQVNEKLETANSKLSSAQNQLENVTNITAAETALQTAEQALSDAKLALSKQMKEDKTQTAVSDLNLSALLKQIEEQKEEVAEITEKTVGTELIAKYGGVVTTVNVRAGSSTEPQSVMAQIAVEDNGYSAEISLTKEQAAEVKVGDKAEVSSSSSYAAKITATVESVKNDLSGLGDTLSGGFTEGGSGSGIGTGSGSSGAGKIIVFRLDGDVTLGESLNFTLSRESSNYDTIVPNSAVNNDGSGAFVLVITDKRSPLGTRYVANRVNVTVVESDDNNSAVTGGITQEDSVITTSNKAVEPRDYVRLAESN